MSVSTFQGVVENGLVSIAGDVRLPERSNVYVDVLEAEAEQGKPKFDLAEMISRMPADYQVVERGFGSPVGREEW